MSSQSEPALRELLSRLWGKLEPRRRRQFGLAAALMFLSALSEVLSLGALLPFLAILTAPDAAFRRPGVAAAARFLGVTSPQGLALPLTAAFAAAALASGAARVLFLWVSTRLAFACGADLSIEAYRRTLSQPYSVHTTRNSSDVISALSYKLKDVMFNVLLSVLSLSGAVVVCAAIVAALIVINPAVALCAAAAFGGTYGVVTWVSRLRLERNSRRIADEQTQVIRALQEGLGGIRNVLLDGTQPFYCGIYRDADRRLRHALGENVFIGASPRFVMEAAGMTLIAGLAYGLSRGGGGLAAAVPALGALALGAQRLIPAMQLIYSSWANVVGSQAALSDILEFLDQPIPPEARGPAQAPLVFRDSIRLDQVRFRYAADGPWILDGLDLSIRRGARVGFVGSTGSGKSTTLDILMGLLTPIEGALLVDGQAVSGARVRAWQDVIAHVPQSIFLADSSLAENIAFGVPPEAIDHERVREAARRAQIADFIEASPEGYRTRVGERGVRLSGGQRQRIGIARALYKRADVLVFDEATSALDNLTERAVMEAIEGLDRELTVLLVAHRLTTVLLCDLIVEFRQGRIAAQGTYDQLLAASSTFQRMACSGPASSPLSQ